MSALVVIIGVALGVVILAAGLRRAAAPRIEFERCACGHGINLAKRDFFDIAGIRHGQRVCQPLREVV